MHYGLTVVEAGPYTARVARALDMIDSRDGQDETALDLALGRLAAGRFEHVRATIEAATADNDCASSLPLIVARHVAWSGDLRTAAAAWQQVRRAVDGLLANDTAVAASAADGWLRAHTAAELQRTAGDLGDAMLAASLHRLLRISTDSSAATMHSAGGDTQASAGSVILDFVHRTLGIEPDATRHRVRIRPRLDACSMLDVRQIRFGDGDLRIAATAAPSGRGVRHTVVVAQDSGAIPATLLLEPAVVGQVVQTSVDGSAATIDPGTDGEGATIVPVQLVLDDERRLEIDVV